MDLQTIAIAATFTAEPVEKSLAFWMRELDLPATLGFAPYNQVVQELLEPTGFLRRNRQGVNIVLVRFEDYERYDDALKKEVNSARAEETIRRNLHDLVAALHTASRESQVPYLVCICPASPRVTADAARVSLFRAMEQELASKFLTHPGVLIATTAEINAAYPVDDYDDPLGDSVGHIPYTPIFFSVLGTFIARKVHCIKAAPFKVIAVDCDETLWHGVCGEVGPWGIEVDAPRRALQEFLVAQRERGMLICLSSKNDEADLKEVFRCRAEMPLKLEDIVAARVNWRPKSANLISLADELKLGLDSFIFIDDNPVECAEVQANCPDVLVLGLPPAPEEIPHFLDHVWAFDHGRITKEDVERTDHYRQELERSQLQKASTTLADFLASLALEVRISPVRAEQLARVAQLTQRTNQFNLTTIRRSAVEIQNLIDSGRVSCEAVEVRDRFGDYGLVGVLAFRKGLHAVEVDSFLLSCRVLGRGVEHRMLNRLGEAARSHGLDSVELQFFPTAKNRPTLEFLEKLNLAPQPNSGDNGIRYTVPLEYAATASYSMDFASARIDHTEARHQGVNGHPLGSARVKTLRRIASELRTCEQLHLAICTGRSAPAAGPSPSQSDGDPEVSFSPVEQAIADIWSEVLEINSVRFEEDFFQLGGDSLRAALVISRLWQAFGVILTLDNIFEAPTVARLAAVVLERLTESLEDEEMASLLGDLRDS